MIRARGLVKDFVASGRLRAVDHLSFEVAPGEIYGLLGPNGAGKTTAMRLLSRRQARPGRACAGSRQARSSRPSHEGGATMVARTTETGAERASRVTRSSYPDIAIPEVSLTELVLGKAAERGDKPAIIDGPSGRTISYAQLVDGVRRTAAGLAAHGLRKGDVLGIYSPNVPEYAMLFHAVASLGGISTTVNPLYTPRELAQQLRDANASYLFTVPMFMDHAREALKEVSSDRARRARSSPPRAARCCRTSRRWWSIRRPAKPWSAVSRARSGCAGRS